MQTKGQLYILSAPSGAGKTTLLKQVMETISDLSFSVSHTTRESRSGEKDGVDYHFVTWEEFQKMQDQDLFLESAEVHGNYYGTSRLAVLDQLVNGQDVILDIDVQGAAIISKDQNLDPISIFVAPPSLSELERRLRARNTDSDETIALRLQNGEEEMEAAPAYHYLVINDKLEEALLVLQSIIIAERSHFRRLPGGDPITLETEK